MRKFLYLTTLLCLLGPWGVNSIYAQIGLLSFDGDLALTSSGIYQAELKDLSGPGVGHDQVVVTGNLSLDGTLDVLESGYLATIGDAFEIMTYTGALTGTFATINWPADMVAQGWIIDYGILFPGKVTIYEQSSLLPVDFLSFTGEQRNGLHWLRWETATEAENDHFAVEYSKDGEVFLTLGKVEGQAFSQEVQQYDFSYKPTSGGNYYYRLKQVDFDGTFEYSTVISIFSDQEIKASFYPNPTNGRITFEQTIPGLVVYNLAGQEVLRFENESFVYDLTGLPNGVFFIKANGSSSLTERIVIEKQ